jgi:hypothetical protein
VEWDVSKGETESTIIDASTTIGLLFKFWFLPVTRPAHYGV